MFSFKSFNLQPSILEALDRKGYEVPTPIQAKAIPYLLEGGDLLGIAQTGTGKTAAFSLPILNRLGKNKKKTAQGHVRVLILTPTRELASQIDENIKLYGKGLGLFSTTVFGGVSSRPQIKALSRGLDILVATPGRLLDLMGGGYVKFDKMEVFVLDEADRMLDMGFIRDIRRIITKLPKERQTLLFSATMPEEISSLAISLLKNPKRVDITPEVTTVNKIKQKINFVEKSKKPLLLEKILKNENIKSVLVFSRTKHGADRVVKFLNKEKPQSGAIHGNKPQRARERALKKFRDAEMRVLVATDIAARGIDIPQVSHVINYDLPDDPEGYVHRIGRTGRAGRNGIAISFCDAAEEKRLKAIEKFIKCKIPVDTEYGYHKRPLRAAVEKKSDPSKKRRTKKKKTKKGRSFRTPS